MNKEQIISDKLESSLFFTSEQKDYFKKIISNQQCIDFLEYFFCAYSDAEKEAYGAIANEMTDMNKIVTKKLLESEARDNESMAPQSILQEAYI